MIARRLTSPRKYLPWSPPIAILFRYAAITCNCHETDFFPFTSTLLRHRILIARNWRNWIDQASFKGSISGKGIFRVPEAIASWICDMQ